MLSGVHAFLGGEVSDAAEELRVVDGIAKTHHALDEEALALRKDQGQRDRDQREGRVVRVEVVGDGLRVEGEAQPSPRNIAGFLHRSEHGAGWSGVQVGSGLAIVISGQAKPMPSSESSLPAAYAREVVQVCARFEVPAEEVVSGLELSLDALSDPETRVPLPWFERLVRRAERLTGEPGLAYHVGLHSRVSLHGFVGFAAMTASTLGDALGLAERFGRTRTDAVTLVTRREGDTASVILEEHVPLGELREFMVTALFLGLATIGDGLVGRSLPGHVEVTHAEPAYFPRFLQALPALEAVRFGRAVNRIVFPAELLELPLVSADPSATRLALEQCERELAALGTGARIVGRLRALLGSEGCLGLEVAARRLSVSSRTLKRRLAEQGTTFSNVRDDVRRHRALLLLDNHRLSLDEVAARLGYSDTANFSRAFKRWTGKTPGEVRSKQSQP